MAKPRRSLETLAQAIRQSLEEVRDEGHELCIAEWPEADSDGGYLLHVDGRMVALGDYQHGFRHLDELQASSDARQEAGQIAGSLKALDFSDSGELSLSDRLDLLSSVSNLFGVHAPLIEKALRDPQTAEHVTVLAMFELLAGRTGKRVDQGYEDGNDELRVTRDILSSRPKQLPGGAFVNEEFVLLRQDEIVKGGVYNFKGAPYADIKLSDGTVRLESDEFVHVNPISNPICPSARSHRP